VGIYPGPEAIPAQLFNQRLSQEPDPDNPTPTEKPDPDPDTSHQGGKSVDPTTPTTAVTRHSRPD